MWRLEPAPAPPVSRRFAGSMRDFWGAAEPRRNDANVLIINGHPDPRPERFCAALCGAFLDGARADGSRPSAISVGALPAEIGQISAQRVRAFDLVRLAHRLTVIFPLWLDKPPPLLTQFLEQAARYGAADQRIGHAGRFVHIIVTMAMPAFAHRAALRAKGSTFHSQGLISLPGVDSGEVSFIGSVNTISRAHREDWLGKLRRLGLNGSRRQARTIDDAANT